MKLSEQYMSKVRLHFGKRYFLFFVIAAVFFVLSSCDKESEMVEPDIPELLELIVGETYSIPNGAGYNWVVEDTSIAEVSNAVITAKSPGYTSVLAGSYVFNLEVNPIKLYEEPYLVWGGTREAVKKHMKNYELEYENEELLVYNGLDRETFIYYQFNSENGLIYSWVILERANCTWNEFVQFMCWHYWYEFDDGEDTLFFSTDDGKSVISASFTEMSGVPVMDILYFPNPL